MLKNQILHHLYNSQAADPGNFYSIGYIKDHLNPDNIIDVRHVLIINKLGGIKRYYGLQANGKNNRSATIEISLTKSERSSRVC